MVVRHRARGHSSQDRQGHGARASCCLRLLVFPGAATRESFVPCDFTLEIPSPIASQIFLPYSFAMLVAELGLRGLWLQLLGCSLLRFFVKLQVDSCCLVWLDAGWKIFSLFLDMRAGD